MNLIHNGLNELRRDFNRSGSSRSEGKKTDQYYNDITLLNKSFKKKHLVKPNTCSTQHRLSVSTLIKKRV